MKQIHQIHSYWVVNVITHTVKVSDLGITWNAPSNFRQHRFSWVYLRVISDVTRFCRWQAWMGIPDLRLGWKWLDKHDRNERDYQGITFYLLINRSSSGLSCAIFILSSPKHLKAQPATLHANRIINIMITDGKADGGQLAAYAV